MEKGIGPRYWNILVLVIHTLSVYYAHAADNLNSG